MGRILAIDYGLKRTGLAVTDPLQLIASPLEAVATEGLLAYLQAYAAAEPVEAFVLGLPRGLDGGETDATPHVKGFAKRLAKAFPHASIHWIDERFTSKIALQAMVAAGSRKKDRRVKGNIDKVSAAVILQSFLDSRA
jgi:putative Holliday junction resolvase